MSLTRRIDPVSIIFSLLLVGVSHAFLVPIQQQSTCHTAVVSRNKSTVNVLYASTTKKTTTEVSAAIPLWLSTCTSTPSSSLCGWNQTQVPSSSTAAKRVEDANVPEAHRGLHDFLYGEEEDHGAGQSSSSTSDDLTFTRETIYSVAKWLETYASSRIPAVYGVMDAKGTLRYIGVSRNVGLSLSSHVKAMSPEIVSSVQMRSFKFPKREEVSDSHTGGKLRIISYRRGNVRIYSLLSLILHVLIGTAHGILCTFPSLPLTTDGGLPRKLAKWVIWRAWRESRWRLGCINQGGKSAYVAIDHRYR